MSRKGARPQDARSGRKGKGCNATVVYALEQEQVRRRLAYTRTTLT